MTDMGNQSFDQFQPARPEQVPPEARPAPAASNQEPVSDNAAHPIGVVLEIAGSGSMIALDLQRLNECMEDEDPSIALAAPCAIAVDRGFALVDETLRQRHAEVLLADSARPPDQQGMGKPGLLRQQIIQL